MTAVTFPPRLFADPTSAQRSLNAIHEVFIASGSQFPLEQFSQALQGYLHKSPDPDAVVANLLRFSEATLSKASLFNDLLKYPVTFEILVKLFGYSQYFSDILVRDPELFRWLTASDVLMVPQTKELLVAEVRRIEQMFSKPERRLNALRRLYRREVLRIGARDILGNADLVTATKELSTLADVLVDASCRLAGATLREKFGATPETPYAVIGLGKLGGEELNYSSDIDIIFVYDQEGELSSGNLTRHEYFNKFVEKVVQNLSESTAEGHMYRVDTRLRPDSGMGPLARSVQSYLLYYESRGELWERQMLIKARPVAGDIEFGKRFLHQLVPFVYPRTYFTHPTEAIARIKSRIEAAIADDDNIKLQAGGIRDIEFVVQALQLLNGGRNESIRCSNTLQTIDLLASSKLLSSEEHDVLKDAYIFFRTLEHRLQMVMNSQTHTIPSDNRSRDALARRMGLATREELEERLALFRKMVRVIFDSVLALRESVSDEMHVGTLVDGGLGDEDMQRALERFGFKDVHKARRILQHLLSGTGLASGQAFTSRARDAFRSVAPEVFDAIARSPSPDLALLNLNVLAAAHPMAEQFFHALREESFRRFVFKVCATSARLTRALAKDRLMLELLATNPASLLERLPRTGKSEDLHKKKEREELRSCIRYVLGVSTFDDLTTELSLLADEIVGSVFRKASRSQRGAGSALAVFALGKYGTRELSVNADLDLVFVSEGGKRAGGKMADDLATRIIKGLTNVGASGHLYDVDARLRPEGRSAPLVVEREAYAAYLQDRASLWERQSLTRLRFVCGSKRLGHQVLGDVDAFVYDPLLKPAWTDEIVAMRKKMETRSHVRSGDFFDVKLGPGGMADIEFIAQMAQLRFGHSAPSLKARRTTEVLADVPGHLLSDEQKEMVIHAYRLFRTIEVMIRLTLDERTTIVPDGEPREILARVLGMKNGDELVSRVSALMKGAREMFLYTAKSLSAM